VTALAARLGGGLPGSYWKLLFASAGSNLADGMFWIALPLLAITLTDSPALIAGVVAFSGIFLGAFNVTFQSLRQRVVPDRILGRVVASFRMLGWDALPLGAALGGLIGEGFGLTAVFAFATVATLLLVPIRLVITDDLIARVEREAEAERALEATP